MGGACSVHGRDDKLITFWSEGLKGIDHLEDLA
jgi:hypothetical protein